MTEVKENIQQTVTENDVVLFMKGTKEMPQCGFSSRVAGVLNYMGVNFKDVNVLADDAVRQGIKDFSDWPTIPQLYVKGEFVGGCDIVREMFDSSLRAGRYVLENIGLTEYEAAEAERVFYQHDRHSVQELAKLWRDDIPSVDNEPYIARAKELERDLEALLLAQLQKEDAA